jgi:hypothetical protein
METSMRKVLIAVAAIFVVTPAFAQKLAVKIINRQNNDTDYTYIVPGRWNSNSNTNVNCLDNANNVNCNGSTRTTGSGTPNRSHTTCVEQRSLFSCRMVEWRSSTARASLRSASPVLGAITEVAACR